MKYQPIMTDYTVVKHVGCLTTVVCSTWNLALALAVYANECQSAPCDVAIRLWRTEPNKTTEQMAHHVCVPEF